MKIIPITDLTEQLNTSPLALALGNFDGVHRGHLALLDKARASKLTSAVFTFGDKASGVITPLAEKARLFAENGISQLFVAPFSLFRELSPEAFLCYLKDKLSARELICGYNFRFGKGASGNADTLLSLAKDKGLHASVIEQVTYQGMTVSASEIRAALKAADLEKARALLARPYSLSGTIKRGFGIGKELSFPTINLPLSESLLPHGVYMTEVVIEGVLYPAITNIGTNPTFEREGVTCESHLLNASGDFYEKEAVVRFFAHHRGERVFATSEELKMAVDADIAAARLFHERR